MLGFIGTVMDSQVQIDGRLMDIVDDEWRKVNTYFILIFPRILRIHPLFKDQLPEEDIAVPLSELPDPEADNGNTGESVREQENKWTDLALNQLAESNTAASN